MAETAKTACGSTRASCSTANRRPALLKRGSRSWLPGLNCTATVAVGMACSFTAVGGIEPSGWWDINVTPAFLDVEAGVRGLGGGASLHVPDAALLPANHVRLP